MCGIGRKIDIDEQSRIENPEIDLHKYSSLIFDKDTKGIQWRKDSFLTSGTRAIDYVLAKKMNLTFATKINSQWFTDLHVKHKISRKKTGF